MTQKLPLVAIAIDGGPDSEHVAKAGAEIARALGGRGVLLHCMPITPTVTAFDRADCRLRILAKNVGDLGAKVLSGLPAESINAWAESVDAEVIVVGARREVPRFERGLATIDGLLRRASRPIWVVRPGIPFPPQKALFAVSTAESSDLAVEAAMALEKRLGWNLRHVVASAVTDSSERILAHARIRRLAEQNDIDDPSLRVEEGSALEVMGRVADSEQCDLIVAGSGVPRGWARLRFGSVASDLAYKSHCHVLVVPEDAGWCYRATEEGLASRRMWNAALYSEPLFA